MHGRHCAEVLHDCLPAAGARLVWLTASCTAIMAPSWRLDRQVLARRTRLATKVSCTLPGKLRPMHSGLAAAQRGGGGAAWRSPVASTHAHTQLPAPPLQIKRMSSRA